MKENRIGGRDENKKGSIGWNAYFMCELQVSRNKYNANLKNHSNIIPSSILSIDTWFYYDTRFPCLYYLCFKLHASS